MAFSHIKTTREASVLISKALDWGWGIFVVCSWGLRYEWVHSSKQIGRGKHALLPLIWPHTHLVANHSCKIRTTLVCATANSAAAALTTLASTTSLEHPLLLYPAVCWYCCCCMGG
jgi:hypothetical protein